MVRVGGKKKPKQESESDSDAPEQLTLSSGREEAELLRKEEREHRRRIQAAAKQKRQEKSQKKSQKKKKEVSSDEQLENTPVVLQADEAGANLAREEKGNKSSKRPISGGLLDESILNILAAEEKKVVGLKTSALVEENPKKRKKFEKFQGMKKFNSSSRIKLVLLKDNPPSNSKSALDFRQERLHGALLQRSLVMLPKS